MRDSRPAPSRDSSDGNRWSGRFARAMRDADKFLAQTPEDAARLIEMGAEEDRVEITGNLKYDVEPPALGHFGKWLTGEIQRQERWPVLVAGSVVAEEE